MNTATQNIINNLAHTRNRIVSLSMKVEDIEVMQELSIINATINNTIYNLKSTAA